MNSQSSWLKFNPSVPFNSIFCLFLLMPATAAEKCSFDGLKEYSLVLSENTVQKNYIAKIFLPKIMNVKGEFCGYWISKELTHNKKHQFYGYIDNNSYITLNPELVDMGLGIRITDNSQWAQKGKLIKYGYAATEVGTYKIESK